MSVLVWWTADLPRPAPIDPVEPDVRTAAAFVVAGHEHVAQKSEVNLAFTHIVMGSVAAPYEFAIDVASMRCGPSRYWVRPRPKSFPGN
jgi:hypothetical protein